jgi:multidrug resistance efflux pump
MELGLGKGGGSCPLAAVRTSSVGGGMHRSVRCLLARARQSLLGRHLDGYFEETNLAPIRVRDPAQIKLMGRDQIVRGHVDSIARAINVANAQPNSQGVATVNPILTWVRLAQRIPVRIHIDEVPPGVALTAGMTATVAIDDGARASAR